jgi:hypothetical protein
VYDADTGEETLRIEAPGGIVWGRFSLDWTWFACAVGQENGLVRVYDVRTGKQAYTIKGPSSRTSGSFAVAFSPDGTRLAATGKDRTLRVWEAPRDAAAWQAARRQDLVAGGPIWHRTQAGRHEHGGRWFAAEFHLRQALAADPNDAALHLRRAWGLLHLGKLAEAGREMQTALAHQDGLCVPPGVLPP